MNDLQELRRPAALDAIERDAAAMGFTMAAEARTGALLRTLAAAKPGGSFLELGTGVGASTSWILDGMDRSASLLTVDNNPGTVAIARRHLGHDRRVAFSVEDGAAFLATQGGRKFDLIFADTWPGKFDHLDEALALLQPGGIYLVDDLLPQPNWPSHHAVKVPVFIDRLEHDPRLLVCKLAWSSGLLIAVPRFGDG
jgi:predicted O-methyltransferase YrrM